MRLRGITGPLSYLSKSNIRLRGKPHRAPGAAAFGVDDGELRKSYPVGLPINRAARRRGRRRFSGDEPAIGRFAAAPLQPNLFAPPLEPSTVRRVGDLQS